ncbi:anti-sigma factor [Pontibacter pamirensis]|uniref:anti-sigma factor n=1 Tax=Pontibacter pamirensis TaxID=2562824 RepID=UPI00138A2328|nr:anti-sigma factor [Pontibacter pamirensis]
MNKEEDYIASGVLELYAAGALSEEERLEIERVAANSPEVRAALDEACAVMEHYAALHAVQPPPALKARVLGQIVAQSPVAIEEEKQQSVRPLYPVEDERGSSAYKWMLAASIALFLLSGFMSIRFYQNWQEAEEKLAQALTAQETLAQNYQTTSYQLQQQEQVLRVLRNADFQPVRLQGVEAHPEADVLVYWNPEEREVYVGAVQLPAPPAGKQYQLWALLDGKPIDAGLINMESNQLSLQQMKEIGAAQAFAVTLEPAGGSVNPTLEQLYVMGEVKS